MLSSRSRYGGTGRVSISSHGESWETVLDDTTESDFDDVEDESTEDELPVISRNTYTQRQFSQPQRAREPSYPNNSSSNASGIFVSQLLNSSLPQPEDRKNGSKFLRALFSPPEAQPTSRRSEGQSTARVAPRDPGRAEREAALRNVGAHVEVIGVTQDFRFAHNVSTRPCDLSLRVLENLKWVAFNFKRELPGNKITKIEFILNDRLYKRFQKTRDEFKRLGKSTKELLLYHGTAASNVNRFKLWWG
jgi:hypothetical protein